MSSASTAPAPRPGRRPRTPPHRCGCPRRPAAQAAGPGGPARRGRLHPRRLAAVHHLGAGRPVLLRAAERHRQAAGRLLLAGRPGHRVRIVLAPDRDHAQGGAARLRLRAVTGIVFGIALGQNRFLADVFGPYIKIVNAIPRIVLGSIFVVAFGIGELPKILLAAVLVFFVVFFNAFQGVREVDRNILANARVLGASPMQIVRHVVLPSALTGSSPACTPPSASPSSARSSARYSAPRTVWGSSSRPLRTASTPTASSPRCSSSRSSPSPPSG